MNTDFVLPEKWYIEITDDNREIVNNWKIRQQFNRNLFNYKAYKYVKFDGSGIAYTDSEMNPGFLITTEQFIEHVLHQPISKSESKKENLDYLIPIFKELNIK